MTCDWEKIKGTGIDEPAVFRCTYSHCEDIRLDCPNECCEKCPCDCNEDLETDNEEDDENYPVDGRK
jgi:hypothetical protein